jgi:hypothetical protein
MIYHESQGWRQDDKNNIVSHNMIYSENLIVYFVRTIIFIELSCQLTVILVALVFRSTICVVIVYGVPSLFLIRSGLKFCSNYFCIYEVLKIRIKPFVWLYLFPCFFDGSPSKYMSHPL